MRAVPGSRQLSRGDQGFEIADVDAQAGDGPVQLGRRGPSPGAQDRRRTVGRVVAWLSRIGNSRVEDPCTDCPVTPMMHPPGSATMGPRSHIPRGRPAVYPAAMLRSTLWRILLCGDAARGGRGVGFPAGWPTSRPASAEERLALPPGRGDEDHATNPRLSLALARRSLAVAEELDDAHARYQALVESASRSTTWGTTARPCASTRKPWSSPGNWATASSRATPSTTSASSTSCGASTTWPCATISTTSAIQLEMDNPSGAARCYNNIAGVQQTAGNYPAALEDYHRALDIYRALGEAAFEASTLNNIGLVQYEMGDFDAGPREPGSRPRHRTGHRRPGRRGPVAQQHGTDQGGPGAPCRRAGSARAGPRHPARDRRPAGRVGQPAAAGHPPGGGGTGGRRRFPCWRRRSRWPRSSR